MKQNPPFTASDSPLLPHPTPQHNSFFSFSCFYVSRPGETKEEEPPSGAGCHLDPSGWQVPPVTRYLQVMEQVQRRKRS